MVIATAKTDAIACSLQRTPQSERAPYVCLVVGLLTHCRPRPPTFSLKLVQQWSFIMKGRRGSGVRSHTQGSSQRLDHPGIAPEFPVHSPARIASKSPRTTGLLGMAARMSRMKSGLHGSDRGHRPIRLQTVSTCARTTSAVFAMSARCAKLFFPQPRESGYFTSLVVACGRPERDWGLLRQQVVFEEVAVRVVAAGIDAAVGNGVFDHAVVFVQVQTIGVATSTDVGAQVGH